MRWPRMVGSVCLCLIAVPPAKASSGTATPSPTDPQLRQAVQLVLDGDYTGGLAALETSLRRLEGAPGNSADRAVAHLYAGYALVAKGQMAAGKERFRRALLENPSLELTAEQFPPKVRALFAEARADLERGRGQAVAAPLRLVHSASGSRGSVRGSEVVIEDERGAFEPPSDRQAVVAFEWEAGAGSYRLRGAWRDPKGSVVLQPDVEVTSVGGRLSAYWVLALPESVTPGQWTLEISHDGQSIGERAIQVLPRATERLGEAPPDDLYALIAPALVVIERRDADGRVFGRGLGFFVESGLVATAFQVVEGARSLRLVLADQSALLTDRVAAWDRWQDWALLEVPSGARPALRVSRKAPAERQQFRVIDLDGEDKPYFGRAVVASLSSAAGKTGERLALRVAGSVTASGFRLMLPREAAGGPVVDANGEVVGILGGSLVPGESSAEGRLPAGPSLATPAAHLARERGPGATLAELIARGESLEPSRRSDLSRVALANGGQGAGPAAAPQEEGAEFARAGRCFVWAFWTPRARRSATLRAQLRDAEGAVLAQGEPVRAQFETGQTQTSVWPFDLLKLPAGVHRVEVLLDGDVVWRGYLRVTE